MYNNYIFDLYGTLVDIKTNEKKAEFWEKLCLLFNYQGAAYDPDELKAKFKKYSDKLKEVSGQTKDVEINIEDVFYYLYRKKGIKAKRKVIRETGRTFRLLSTEHIQLYPYVIKVLTELKKKDKKIYLLTNAQAAFTHGELIALGIDKYFDGVFISSDEGVKKPEKAFIKALIKEHKLDIKKSVMIGNDYSTDIEIANRVDMDSVYLETSMANKKAEKRKCTHIISDGDLRKILDLKK